MTESIFSSGDVARQVGIERWQLLYLIERGELPQPKLTVAGRRLFTGGDIAAIKERLALRGDSTSAQVKQTP